jgi:GAF domain-containing protein
MASITAPQKGREPGAPAAHEVGELPREGDLNRLLELVVRLSANLDVEMLHEDILCTVASLHGTGMGLLLIVDEDLGDLVPVFCIGGLDEYCVRLGRVALGEGPYGTAAAEKRMVLVEDVEDGSVDSAHRDLARAAGFRSSCTVPMLTRAGVVLGTLTTCFPVPRRLSAREAGLVEVFALQAAQFLSNARIHQTVRRDAAQQREAGARATLLADLSGALLESSDRSPAGLPEVVRLPTRWFADYCVIDLLGADGAVVLTEGARRGAVDDGVLRHFVGQPISVARQEAIGHVVQTRSPLHLRETDPVFIGAAAPDPRRSVLGLRPRSAILLPLLERGRVFGVMTMVRSRSAAGFGEEDLALASEIAQRVGLAFEHSLALWDRPAPQSSPMLPAVICQELRSQLDLIEMTLRPLGTSRLSSEERTTYVSTVSRFARQAGELLQELEGPLLDLWSGAHPTPIDPLALLREALEPSAEGAADLPLVRVEAHEGLPYVYTDRRRAAQALRHLARFVRTVGPAFEEVRAWVTMEGEGEGVCFWFAGALPGALGAQQGETDETAGWSARRAYHRLIVAKDIIGALGGEVRVEGVPGDETRFSVRLPAIARR